MIDSHFNYCCCLIVGSMCGALNITCMAIYQDVSTRTQHENFTSDVPSLTVRFAMDRGGLVGADGATHCGAFDITYMATLPNMIVMAPSNEAELIHMVGFSTWGAEGNSPWSMAASVCAKLLTALWGCVWGAARPALGK